MQRIAKFMLGAGFAAAVSTGPAAQTKWDMPTPYPHGKLQNENSVPFARDVDKATGGALKITVHSAGSLVKHPDIKNSVKRGVAPIGEVLISLHANESPIYGLD